MEAELISFIQSHPNMAYLVVFSVLLACGLGLPMPEDITLVAGGYAVYLADTHQLGHPRLLPMVGVGLMGVLSGDVILFALGRWGGPRVATVWPFRLLFKPARLERTRLFFRRYGGWTAFVARFAAGFRAPTYLLAGSMGMRTRTFLLADGGAALISVPLLVWLAWRFGAQIDRVKGWLADGRYALLVLFCLLGIWLAQRWIRGRRAQRSATQAKELRGDEFAATSEESGEN